MSSGHRSGIKRVATEIRQEVSRQLRGFPREFKRQLTGGWRREAAKQVSGFGHELGRQLFSSSGHRRRQK